MFGVTPNSAGRKLAVPSVTSTPPAFTNLSISATPSSPMPPVMSSDSPYIPRVLNSEPLALRLVAAAGGDRRRVRLRCAAASVRVRCARVPQPQLRRVRAARALDLVHPDHAVVVRRLEREIAWRQNFHVAMRPHAGHAVLRHLRHLKLRHNRTPPEKNGMIVRICGH